jgi:hypothetical protein
MPGFERGGPAELVAMIIPARENGRESLIHYQTFESPTLAAMAVLMRTSDVLSVCTTTMTSAYDGAYSSHDGGELVT